MTNERKFLNSNVSAYEFSMAFNLWCFNNKGLGTSQADKMQLFLNSEARPTLTEDERVILRNVDPRECNVIGRDKYTEELYLAYSKTAETEDREYLFDVIFPTLFQFIKERRRIFY